MGGQFIFPCADGSIKLAGDDVSRHSSNPSRPCLNWLKISVDVVSEKKMMDQILRKKLTSLNAFFVRVIYSKKCGI